MESSNSDILNQVNLIADFFKHYIAIWFIIFGVTGNIISIVVFIRTRKLDKTSSAFLGPLACFDLANVLLNFAHWIVYSGKFVTNGLISFDNISETKAGCQAYNFFYQYFMGLSSWTLVLFSLERCAAIWWPLKMTTMITQKRRRTVQLLMVVLLVPIFAMSLEIWDVFYFPIGQNVTTTCGDAVGVDPFIKGVGFAFAILMTSGLPSIIIVIVNTLIIIGVRKGDKMAADRQSETAAKNTIRCLRNLLLVSTCYVILVFPWSCSIAWYGLATTAVERNIALSVLLMLEQWASINFSINPLLYSISMDYYRNEVIKLVTCGLIHTRKRLV